MAEWTGLEPATPCVTGRYSNQLNYHSALCSAWERSEYYGLPHASSTLFLTFFNRLLQKSPEWSFPYGKRTNYARQRQLPPFFCTRSRRDSWAANSSSVAKTTRSLLDCRTIRWIPVSFCCWLSPSIQNAIVVCPPVIIR